MNKCIAFVDDDEQICRYFREMATIIRCDATRMDLRFDGEIAPGPYQLVLRRMNAGGKSSALARLKVSVVE